MTNSPDPDRSDSQRAEKPRLETIGPRLGTIKDDLPPDEPVTVVDNGSATEGTPKTLRDRLHRNRTPVSSMLISLLLHAVLLLLLTMAALGLRRATRLESGVTAEFTAAPLPDDPHQDKLESVQIDLTEMPPSPTEQNAIDQATDDRQVADSEIPSVVPVEVLNPTPASSAVELATSPAESLPTGGGLQGREADARAKLAAQHGGSEASEQAVERALEWILAHQYEDGGWRLQFHDGPCDGRCGDEGSIETPNAATALALLSLLGAGYTTESGPYQKEVAHGIEFLIDRQRVNKFGGSFREGEQGMYAHALATMALSEAFALAPKSEWEQPILLAAEYIENAQHGRGGWRYEPGYPGDMLVTGWQLMALKSVQQAGFRVDAEVLEKADQFVDSLAVSSPGLYRYGPERRGEEPASTAVGLLMKMYLGRAREHPALSEGALYLSDFEPSPNDVYFNYYASLVLHHRRGSYWPAWNEKMREHLIATQVRQGHAAGSWHFPHEHGRVGGRLYSTAMAAMTLEVYYRFLPLYGYEAESIQARRDSE